jgi:hypothetical protein
VDAGRLEVLDSDGDISGHTEVRILVDTLGDEARDVGSLSEDVGERVGEGGDGLDGRVGELAAVVTFVDAEYALELVVGDAFLDFADVLIEDSAHVFCVGEDEGSVKVESAGRISLQFSIPYSIYFSRVYSPLKKNFSSSVIWTTTGTLKASWRYLVKMKGSKWPRCMASEEGPLPV